MKNPRFPIVSETVLAAAVIAALVLLINPFGLIMTSAVTLSIGMLLAVALIAFGVFVWREKPRDEREAFCGLQSARISYFFGAGVLVLAVIVQTMMHHLDVWLALALGAMVLTKLAMSIYMRNQ